MFNGWEAFASLEPFGGEREMLARIASLLTILAIQGGSKSGDVLDASDSIMRAFMPAEWIGQPKPDEAPDIGTQMAQFEKAVAAAYG